MLMKCFLFGIIFTFNMNILRRAYLIIHWQYCSRLGFLIRLDHEIMIMIIVIITMIRMNVFQHSTSRGCLSENEKTNTKKTKEKLKTCIYYLDTLATH